MNNNQHDVRLKTRLLIFAFFSLFTLLASKHFTDSWIPLDPLDNVIFIGALLLVIIGSTVQEYYYNNPLESMMNSFIAILTILPVYSEFNRTWWFILFGLFIILFVFSAIYNFLFSIQIDCWFTRKFRNPILSLGRGRFLYSILFFHINNK